MTCNHFKWHTQYTTIKAKSQSRKLAAIYYRAAESCASYRRRADNVYQCCDTVAVSEEDGNLLAAYRCKDRLCPICARIDSSKAALNAKMVLDIALSVSGRMVYMLTLTQRNCSSENLPQRVTEMLAAWDYLIHNLRTHRRYVLGYARSLEITVGRNRNSDYHPHIHALLIVRDDVPRALIRPRYWAERWQYYMKTHKYQNVMPICDIRRIRPNAKKGASAEAAAAAEVAKYITKIGKVLDMPSPDAHVIAIDKAVRGRRLRSYGGIWRTIRRDLRLSDDADISTSSDSTLSSVPYSIWQWSGMEYVPYIAPVRAKTTNCRDEMRV